MRAKSPRQREDDRRLKERAAEWLGELPSTGADERVEFAKWVRESPQHLEEFLFAAVAAEAIRRVDVEANSTLKERLAGASGRVVPLPRAMEASDLSLSAARKRRPWLAWAALLVGLSVALSMGYWVLHDTGETYATAVGEQRTVELADHSVIHLNGLSRIQVRYSDRGRAVHLLSGEALFKVAAEPARPFEVLSGATVIRALGTEFGVLRRASGTTVSVAEGLVEVANERLAAGEEIRVASNGRIERRAPVDVAAISSWRQHRLVFRDETLIDVAAQFNRFNRAPRIAVEGDVERARRLSGVFDANDPKSLIHSLSDDPDLDVKEDGDRLVIRVR